VDDVVLKDGKVTVKGTGENLVTEVIRCISESSIHVTDFRTVIPTLEDVFLRVTGHSIRD
jgi:ABC-2 type transport system ATP-binding protein